MASKRGQTKLKKWMDRLWEAGSRRDPERVRLACEQWENDSELRKNALLDGGPLGKAARLCNPWLVNHLLEQGRYPVTRVVVIEAFIADTSKPSWVSEIEAVWKNRHERKRLEILKALAAHATEDDVVNCLRENLVQTWVGNVGCPHLESQLDLLLSLQSAHEQPHAFDQVEAKIAWEVFNRAFGDPEPVEPGTRTLLQWAWMCRRPDVLQALVEKGHDPFHQDTGTGCPGWSLMGAFRGEVSRRFQEGDPADPILANLQTEILDADRQCWSLPEWAQLKACLKNLSLQTHLADATTSSSTKKPRM